MNRPQRRTGCWVCWKRKLRCDSCAPNHCANCAKRGVECQYEEPGTGQEKQGRIIPSQHITEAGIPRDRAQRACSSCATLKLKCSGDQDGCQRCVQNELICRYPNSKRGTKRSAGTPRRRLQQQATTIADQESLQHISFLVEDVSFSKDLIQLHVEAYFEYVYPITTHGFLHQGTILRELDEDKASPALLKTIFISASQFMSSAPEDGSKVTQLADEVDSYIMKNLSTFSVETLQVILLWANHHHSNRKMGKAWMLLGMAARIAYYLQINVESKHGSSSEKEGQRRMMWNIRILDRLLAGTVEEFSLASRFMDKLKLPCDEYFYTAESQAETGTLEAFTEYTGIPNIGGFAGFVGLFDIWRDILLFMRDLSPLSDVTSIREQVVSLQQRLSDLERSLPQNLQFVDRNLYLQASAAQKIRFIMLKSWWHECHYDLYRFSLPGFRESIDLTGQDAEFMKDWQDRAVKSALTQAIFWKLISKAKNVLISDPNVVSLVHSNTRTLLACHNLTDINVSALISTFGGEEVDIAELLSSNVSFLDGLANHFPHVSIIQREIQRVIEKNGIRCSAEAALNEGLPLRRRHSRQELIQGNSGAEEHEESSPELTKQHSNPITTTVANVQSRSITFAPVLSSSDGSVSCMSTSGVDTSIPGQQPYVTQLNHSDIGQNSDPMHLWQHADGQGLSNADNEGSFTSGLLGYFTPFDIAMDDNVSSFGFMGNQEQFYQ